MAEGNSYPPGYPSIGPTASAQSRASRASAAIARLANPFVGGTRPSSSAGFYSGLGMSLGTASHSRTNLASRACHIELPSPANAFCAGPDFDRVVLTGRDYFKIMKIEGTEISDQGSLRLSMASARKQVFPHEVKWGTGFMRDTIAAAIPNGIICIYKDGKMERQLTEHQRQIHRLAFSPREGQSLLSGSADGTVRLWDLRDKKSSKLTFNANSDIVRDVQFNPQNPSEFAAAFDNGTVQRWDIRRTDICERKINAHSGPVLSIDWHPDGRHLASGGRDKLLKVWNLYGDSRRKASISMSTPGPIGGLTWRPPKNGTMTTEIATHPFKWESQIHIWDLRRQFIPSKMVDFHEALVTAVLWVNEDVIWSIGRDSKFAIHDLQYTKNPINDLTFNALDISATGEIAAALMPRNKQKLGLPTFESDEDIVYRSGRMQHGRSSSFRGNRTPSQLNLLETLATPMDMSQPLALINLKEFFDEDRFRIFAQKWQTYVEPGDKISDALKHNAQICLDAGYHSEWKTWKMMAISLEHEEKEAEKLIEKAAREAEMAARAASVPASVTDRRKNHLGGAKTISNPSTRTTPLARPVPDTPKYESSKAIERVHDHFLLPPAAYSSPHTFSATSNAGEALFTSPLARVETNESYRAPVVEEDEVTSYRSSSSSSYEEELVYNVFPHSQAKPILIKRPHQKREGHHQHIPTYATGLREFGSGSYDDKPLVRDSSDDASTEFGSHKDEALPSVENDDKKPIPEKKSGVYVPRVHLPGKFVWAPRPEKVRPWSAEVLIPKAIELYTNAGDVQFSATLACLVARVIDLDHDQTDTTIMAYIDLLHSRKLFTRAAYISKYSPTATPRKVALNGTYVLLSCGHCRKPLLNEHKKGYWLCDHCKKAQDGCVLCREMVRGQWAFCQACGHGGHPECLRSWYVGEAMEKCPAVGCGHVCISVEM